MSPESNRTGVLTQRRCSGRCPPCTAEGRGQSAAAGQGAQQLSSRPQKRRRDRDVSPQSQREHAPVDVSMLDSQLPDDARRNFYCFKPSKYPSV